MTLIEQRFSSLSTDHAPGQEVRRGSCDPQAAMLGERLPGTPVDFSHGNVNVDAFEPTPGSLKEFTRGFERGGEQAYTEYRGGAELRETLARRLTRFTGKGVSGQQELLITPGTQCALFLAVAATVATGDKVAIVRPDYFANRKLVEFMGGEVVPVTLDYLDAKGRAGIQLDQLETAFKAGVKTFLFSNPNNPAGVVYSNDEIERIAQLATRHGATVIVDQLYSRLLYAGNTYTHLRAADIAPNQVLTIMGPSKTESLSGFRLGVAFGAPHLIERMEQLQAIVALRAPGYCQAVLRTWFAEPEGWMQERIVKHQKIRDDILRVLSAVEGVAIRAPEAGSYFFPRLPELKVPLLSFVQLLRVQAGVTVTPGTEFSPSATDSIRLNFSQNHEAAVEAIERLARMIDIYRK